MCAYIAIMCVACFT